MKDDILVSAFNVFIMAFLGVLIPELCVMLQSDFPVDVHGAAVVVSSMICASLAAGLSAAWSFVSGKFAQKNVCQDNEIFSEIVEDSTTE